MLGIFFCYLYLYGDNNSGCEAGSTCPHPANSTNNDLFTQGGHGVPQGEALHCRAPTLGSRRCPDTLHFVAGTVRARSLTDWSPVIIADGHKAHPYFEAKNTTSGSSVSKVEILVR